MKLRQRVWAALISSALACRGPEAPSGGPVAPDAVSQRTTAVPEPLPPAPATVAERAREPSTSSPLAQRRRGAAVHVWSAPGWNAETSRIWPQSDPQYSGDVARWALDAARGDFGPRSRNAVARVEGVLDVDELGAITLSVRGGPSTRLYVDGVLVARGPESSSALTLAVGAHEVVCEHETSSALTVSVRRAASAEFTVLETRLAIGPRLPARTPASASPVAEIPTPRQAPLDATASDMWPGWSRSDLVLPPRPGSTGAITTALWAGEALVVGTGSEVWTLTFDPPRAARLGAGFDGVLGLARVAQRLFVLQRSELTELVDSDGDGRADEYRCVWSVPQPEGQVSFQAHALAASESALLVDLRADPATQRLVAIDAKSGDAHTLRLTLDEPSEVATADERVLAATDCELRVFDSSGGRLGGVALPDLVRDGAFAAPVRLPSGPHQGQWLVLERTRGVLVRVAVQMEQGAVHGSSVVFAQPHSGLARASALVASAERGLLVLGAPGGGGTRASLARLQFDPQRVFEVGAVRSAPGTLTLEFSEPLSRRVGFDPDQFPLELRTPRGTRRVRASASTPASDRRSVQLDVPELVAGVVVVQCGEGLRSERGATPWARAVWHSVSPAALRESDSNGAAAAALSIEPFGVREAGPVRVFDDELLPAGWSRDANGMHAARDARVLVGRALPDQFELSFEWWLPAGGGASLSYGAGFEFSLCDEDATLDGRDPLRLTGALRDCSAPRVRASAAPGEWNRARIVVAGGRVEHWLNGSLVFEGPSPPSPGTLEVLARGTGLSLRSVSLRSLEN